MNEQAIIERIISDAQTEADALVKSAETAKEEKMTAERERLLQEEEQFDLVVEAECQTIIERSRASARLESAKIILAQKRAIVDDTYALALQALNDLPQNTAVSLANTLLETYAEEGDEIVFAENYAYAEQVQALAVVAKKHLTIGARQPLSGGFILCGKLSDKDVSYGGLLTADREAYQTQLASKLFA